MPKIALVEYFTAEKKTYIFVIRPGDDKPIVLEADVPEATLKDCRDRLFGNEKKNIKASLTMTKPGRPGANIDFFYELSGELAHKFLPFVEGYDTLYIVPHGWLHYLPLHALKDKDGRYLCERFKIIYSPSATVLKYCQAKNKVRQKQRPSKPARNCLALGVGKEKDISIMKEIFHDEAKLVAKEVPGIAGEYRTGIEASKRYFLENCTHKDLIHLACHGYFNENEPLKSGLLLSSGEKLPGNNRDEPDIIDVPEDMLLSAEEIFNLELHADLVVLSACVTGVNENKPGEELIGLTRALIYAGTPSVLVSLWNVHAYAALLFMKSFYEYWSDPQHPLSKVEALQKTQLHMLRDNANPVCRQPFCWAPFILVGDWM